MRVLPASCMMLLSLLACHCTRSCINCFWPCRTMRAQASGSMCCTTHEMNSVCHVLQAGGLPRMVCGCSCLHAASMLPACKPAWLACTQGGSVQEGSDTWHPMHHAHPCATPMHTCNAVPTSEPAMHLAQSRLYNVHEQKHPNYTHTRVVTMQCHKRTTPTCVLGAKSSRLISTSRHPSTLLPADRDRGEGTHTRFMCGKCTVDIGAAATPTCTHTNMHTHHNAHTSQCTHTTMHGKDS